MFQDWQTMQLRFKDLRVNDSMLLPFIQGVLMGAIMQNIATAIAGLTIAFYYSWQLTRITCPFEFELIYKLLH